jgi:PQQ-like domain
MRGKKFITAVVIVCGLVLGFVAGQAAPVVVNGKGQSDADTGECVLFGNDGSVFVCGRLQTGQNNSGLVVIKYSADGEEQWRDVVEGTAPNGLLGTIAAVMKRDSAGNVFVGGSVLNTGSGTDIFVRKYDGHSPDKQIRWTRIVDGGANRDDAVKALLVTSGDDVVIGGYTTEASDSLDMYFAKFVGATGADVWLKPLIIAGTASGFRFDTVNGLAELLDGDFAFVGTLTNTESSHDFTLGRINNGTGAFRWALNVNNSLVNGQDIGYGITIADNGDIIVGGIMRNGFTSGDAAVFRFTAAGSFVWQQIIHKGLSDTIRAVSWRRGVVVAAGNLSESNSSDFFVAGLDENDGHKLWDYLSPGIENSFLSALAIALAPDGVVVTGVSEEAHALSTLQVVKLHPETGTVLWNLPITGIAPLYNEGHAMVVNPDTGAVLVTGFTQNTSLDLTVVSITPEGTEAWHNVVSGVGLRIDRIDATLTLAADPYGRCEVMGGYTQNTSVGLLGIVQDFTLVKVCNGELRWRRVLRDSEPHLGNAALAVAFDGSGNVFGAGRIGTSSPEAHAVVVKYNQRGRKLWETVLPGLDVRSQDEAHAIAIDGTGDVFVAARVSNRFVVFKLDGQSGAVVWPVSVADMPVGTANALVLTPYGSVVAVGAINGSFAAAEFHVATGAEISPRMLAGGGEARAVSLDPEGIPVAVGSVFASSFGNSFMTVVKFSVGVVVWSQHLTGTGGQGQNSASSVVASADGRVFVGGMLTNTGTNADASVVALNADGEEKWRQFLDGTAHLSDAINALSLTDGAVVAGGFLVNIGNRPTGIAVALALQSGAELRRSYFAGTGDFGQNSIAAVVTHGNRAFVAGVITNTDTAQDMFMDEFDFSPDRCGEKMALQEGNCDRNS